jgi:ParB-like chromosome segregation protein Spo0J
MSGEEQKYEAKPGFEELVEAFELTPADIAQAKGDMYQAIANKKGIDRPKAKTEAFFWMYGPIKQGVRN